MRTHRDRRSMVRGSLSVTIVALAAACGGGAKEADSTSVVAALPTWTYDSTMIFPAARGLSRPEDGVALPDGRLIVTDQVNGLRLIETDGTSKPFGELAKAGYMHHPPAMTGGANGVSLEPDGTHLLLADVLGGAIYRVDVASGAAEKVYQHTYGINAAIRDSKGTIWFTQSAQNTPQAGEGRMWASVNIPNPDGALLRLASQDGKLAARAEVVADSLLFANGLAMDEQAGYLYVSEIVGGRLLRFRVDPATGTLGERSVFADSIAADNLELDGEGHLWAVSPLGNQVVILNTATGARHTAFSAMTPAQGEILAEFQQRGMERKPRMELVTPAVWAPLPGMITGVIFAPNGGPVYLTGLGDALVKLPR